MITDIRLNYAPDLSVDNDVMNFGANAFGRNSSISGLSWLVSDLPPATAVDKTLKFVLALIAEKLPSYDVWLLIGNSAWQSDTRVLRHFGLWGALKSYGLDVPVESRFQEIQLAADGKIKYFCATLLTKSLVEAIAKILSGEGCSYLVATPKGARPQSLLQLGWSGSLHEDFNLVKSVADIEYVLLKKVGDFDDRERGFVAVGQTVMLNKLQH